MADLSLFYDPRDDPYHEKRGSRILYWLDDLGAKPLAEARPGEPGFLFAGARTMDDYRSLVASHPRLRDRPEEREPLLRLDSILQRLATAGVRVPMPATWTIGVDDDLPDDIRFPVFVRTASTSWKLGGGSVSRANTRRQLLDEIESLRRHIRWDATIMAREWLELEPAGRIVYGDVPQEVRCWVVDGNPIAWSFHHLYVIDNPRGFPPRTDELRELAGHARAIGEAFASRLVVADFARQRDGSWVFIEAGPGSCAGTAHERVFKFVARRLTGATASLEPDAVGGPLID